MGIVRYLAWVWFIIVGGLIITPKGIWCIVCGQVITQPGSIGQTATMILGIGAVVLGLIGIATEGRAQGARAATAAAGR
jgi:hypothetical protein